MLDPVTTASGETMTDHTSQSGLHRINTCLSKSQEAKLASSRKDAVDPLSRQSLALYIENPWCLFNVLIPNSDFVSLKPIGVQSVQDEVQGAPPALQGTATAQ